MKAIFDKLHADMAPFVAQANSMDYDLPAVDEPEAEQPAIDEPEAEQPAIDESETEQPVADPIDVRIKAQEETLAQLRKDNADMQALLQSIVQKNLEAATGELEAKKAEIIERQKAAFSAGDYEAFTATQKELADLASGAPSAPVKPQPVQTPAFYDEWRNKNSTWLADKKVSAVADAVASAAWEDNAKETDNAVRLKKTLDATEREIARMYPQFFRNPRKTAPAAVSAGSGNEAGRKPVANITPAAQQMLQRMAAIGKVPSEEVNKRINKFK